MRLIIINKKTLAIIVLLLVLSIIFTIFTLYRVRSKDVFKEDIFYKGNTEEKTVAFLCNIDWGNEFIPDILQILKDNKINITFSVTGRWANLNHDLVKEIQNYNHEIGNHGYNHVDYSKLSYEQNKSEILKADTIIKEITGITPKYFGPPSGAFNENTIKAANDLNYKVILWSVDTIDWRKDSTKDIIIKRVTSKIQNSDIVLMHPTAETVKALPELINYLFQNGYKIGTISDVIN